MKSFCLALLILVCLHSSYAQIKTPDDLKQRLQSKTTFAEIKNEVLNYYSAERAKIASTDKVGLRTVNRQLKFWNRYLYWAEMHKNKNGVIFQDMPKRAMQALQNDIQPNAPVSYGAWSFMGPDYAPDGVGRVNRLAFHPTDPNIIYAGTSAGGLWKLTWIGSFYSWTCLTNYLPELSISGIVVSKTNANIIYILTGDGDAGGGFVTNWGYRGNSIGVLKTTDGGANWFATAQFPGLETTGYRGYSLIQDPNNVNILLAATTHGIFKTTDAGGSWERSDLGAVDGNPAYDIEYKPGNSSIVYAACQNQNGDASFFKSSNGGRDFNQVFVMGADGANRAAIAVTPKNPNVVYFLCGPGFIADGNASNNTFKGIFESTNSGDNFTFQTNSPDILGNITATLILSHQSNYDLALAASNTNASIVMVGGLVVWKSEDRGHTFDEMTDYFAADPDDDDCIHPDVHDLAYNPLDGRLYAATDGGVSVSSDNGDHFTTLFAGLQIGQFYHFEPSNEDGLIWGGTQDCGVLLQNSGVNWELYAGGDGYAVLTDKTGNNDDSYHVVNDHINDDALTNSDITPSTETEYFPLIAMHPTNEDVLFAGYTNKLYMSLERGDNWKVRDSYIPLSAHWALAVCPSNANRVYCAGSKSQGVRGMWRIDNITSDNYTALNLSAALVAAGYVPETKITAIAVNPNNSSRVWISLASDSGEAKVLYTGDAGATWQDRSGSLPTKIPATSIVADAGGSVYVGTDIGVYYRNDDMSDWTPFYNGLPRAAVSELKLQTEFDPRNPGVPIRYLYAATFGRGIWRSEVYGDCSSNLNISQTLQGQRFYQAGTNISSTSTVTGGTGTTVNFQSGNNIVLSSGFESTAGIYFHGYLRPCNVGPIPNQKLLAVTDSLLKRKEPLPGMISNLSIEKSSITINLKVNKAGSYSLNLTDDSGNTIKEIFPVQTYQPGQHSLQLNVAEMKGFYRVVLNFNEDQIHFQELLIE